MMIDETVSLVIFSDTVNHLKIWRAKFTFKHLKYVCGFS